MMSKIDANLVTWRLASAHCLKNMENTQIKLPKINWNIDYISNTYLLGSSIFLKTVSNEIIQQNISVDSFDCAQFQQIFWAACIVQVPSSKRQTQDVWKL